MAGKRGWKKGVRNKFRQVLMIEGRPDVLYQTSKYTLCKLVIGKEMYNLGHINPALHKHFEKIPDCAVLVTEKETARTRGVPGFFGLHVRKAGENTTIEVSAPTEAELAFKVEDLKDYLHENGIPVYERCNWICVTDKAKEQKAVSKLPTSKPVPSKPVNKGKRDRSEKTKELREMVIRMGIADGVKAPDYEAFNKTKRGDKI